MKSTCKLMLTTVLAIALVSGATAAEIYVSTVGDDSNGGDAWDNAYATIQHALNQAVSGDTIYVAGRTFTLPATLSWTKPDVTLIGGFEATDPADQPGTPDPEQWPTVFTRTLQVMQINGANNARLENVRVTGGTTHTGGGIQVNNSTGVKLVKCVIDNNRFSATSTATLRGAGLFIYANSSVTMIGCRVENNAAVNARNHTAGAQGGGIWCEGSLVIRDSQIINNITDTGMVNNVNTLGGGVYFKGSSLVMTNVLIAGSYAYTAGSGLHIAGGAANLQNVTVAGNNGGGICLAAGTLALTNGIVWGNGPDIDDKTASGLMVDFTNVGDTDHGGNNISVNPLFEYGYYLAPGSPCMATGSGTATSLGLASYAKNISGDTYGGAETVNLGYHYPTGFDLTYADIYVATTGDDSNSGTAESEPFATLTNALAKARAGSRIHVATGTYTVASGEVFPLVVPGVPDIEILGGGMDNTIIDAAASGRVLSMTYTHRALLKNLTITGGRRTPNHGAGLSIINSYGVTLESCTIADNQYSVSSSGNLQYGGGIYAYKSDLTLTKSIVRDNTMANTHGSGFSRGAGLWSNGSVIIRDSRFTGNAGSSGCAGGAIYFEGSTLNMKNVVFNGNSTDAGGAGIMAGSGMVSFENCTIADNIEEGIRRSGGSVSATNSILWGNGVDSTGTVTIAYSVIGNGGNFVDGGNNIGADPLFVDASAGDYHLQATSPAVGTGLVQAWMAGATDLDGAPRVSGGRVDRGAYQIPAPAGTLLLIR